MNDNGSFSESEIFPAPGEPPRALPVAVPAALEQRVQRLEEAILGLHDLRQLEERVVQRVSQRLSTGADSNGSYVESATNETPGWRASLGFMGSGSAAAAGSIRRALGAAWNAGGDLRWIVRMFFDRRYPLGWSVRLLPLAALLIILLSWLLLSGIWVIGPWLDKAVDLVLAFFVYRMLSCEAARYRQAIGAEAVSVVR